MLSFWRSSLIGRLFLVAILVFALSIPLFWFLFSNTIDRISRDVVDTRMLEFADQVRGFRASLIISETQPERNDVLNISRSGLGGPDIEWVWQISSSGTVKQRSELLQLSGAIISSNITKPKNSFSFSNRQTPIGKLRIAERVIEEETNSEGKEKQPVHYLVGLSETRYAAYVKDHTERLIDLALIGMITLSVGFFVMLILIILLAQHQLAGIKTALTNYQKGDSESIEGQFPAEIQAVINLINDLLHRNQKLVERTRKYVSKIAHDINHPLAILKNGLHGNAEPDVLNRQIDRMTGLVDRYTSLARAIGPEGETNRKTNVSRSLHDTADGFGLLYRQAPLTIECDVVEDLQFVISRHDLEAITSNLVSNAHKFATSTILLSAQVTNEQLVVTVEDDGPGIPPDQLDTVLNWGNRLDEAPPGTGFGLSIVSDIVDLYDGSVHLSRSKLNGLAVKIVIPGSQKS